MILKGDQLRRGMIVKRIKYLEGSADRTEYLDPPGVIQTYVEWAGHEDTSGFWRSDELGVAVGGGWRPVYEGNRYKVVRR